eukprot:TRINITY_DN1506_c4_g1_i1.p1 TRINITY_DN1506_c4_g1~~TRINITY_DN1506_c4_g1_i1.p1  ORF type:complete len:909 (+),score=247.15 TRINITY_DN1506_c4_g1_i1:74-2800(+)
MEVARNESQVTCGTAVASLQNTEPLPVLPLRAPQDLSPPRELSSSRSPRSPRSAQSPRSPRETLRKVRSRDDYGNKMVNQYVVVEEIGRGAYSKVKLVIDSETDEHRAMKIMKRPQLQKARASGGCAWDNALRELALMRKMDHPNVVRLHEVIDDSEDCKLYFILEYLAGGPILVLDSSGAADRTLSPEQCRDYLRDVARGLSYLHQHHIVHRDLKPSNLLLDSIGRVKVSDFGVSVDCGTADVAGRMADSEGTPLFLAPEALAGVGLTSGKPLDIWAVGVTFHTMLYCKLPWNAGSVSALHSIIAGGVPPESADTPASEEARRLLLQMLHANPKERPSALDLLSHPYLQLQGGAVEPAYARVEVNEGEVAKAMSWTSLSFVMTRVVSQMRQLSQNARGRLGSDSCLRVGGQSGRRRSSASSSGRPPPSSPGFLPPVMSPGLSQYPLLQSVMVDTVYPSGPSFEREAEDDEIDVDVVETMSSSADHRAEAAIAALAAVRTTPMDKPMQVARFVDTEGDSVVLALHEGALQLICNGVTASAEVNALRYDPVSGVLEVVGSSGTAESNVPPDAAATVLPRLAELATEAGVRHAGLKRARPVMLDLDVPGTADTPTLGSPPSKARRRSTEPQHPRSAANNNSLSPPGLLSPQGGSLLSSSDVFAQPSKTTPQPENQTVTSMATHSLVVSAAAARSSEAAAAAPAAPPAAAAAPPAPTRDADRRVVVDPLPPLDTPDHQPSPILSPAPQLQLSSDASASAAQPPPKAGPEPPGAPKPSPPPSPPPTPPTAPLPVPVTRSAEPVQPEWWTDWQQERKRRRAESGTPVRSAASPVAPMSVASWSACSSPATAGAAATAAERCHPAPSVFAVCECGCGAMRCGGPGGAHRAMPRHAFHRTLQRGVPDVRPIGTTA